jgi:hypothetical protein
MLEALFATLPQLPALLDDRGRWQSVLINRRKPETYRFFTDLGDLRVCFHKFNACDRHEAFQHPHPWPGAFLVLDGCYRMTTGRSPDRHADPVPGPEFVLASDSAYQIIHPMDWHGVIPLRETFTVMVNGPRWADDVRHTKAVTTQGKNLDPVPEDELVTYLARFRSLVGQFVARIS